MSDTNETTATVQALRRLAEDFRRDDLTQALSSTDYGTCRHKWARHGCPLCKERK